jgi:hypothetical protein
MIMASKAQRDRIGARDGWRCCVCREHVDVDHVWRTLPRIPAELLEAAREILSTGVDERIAAWVDGDLMRARAAIKAWPHSGLSEANELWRAYEALRERAMDVPFYRKREKRAANAQVIAALESWAGAAGRGRENFWAAAPFYGYLLDVVAPTTGMNGKHPAVTHIEAGMGEDDSNLAIAHLGCVLRSPKSGSAPDASLVADWMGAREAGVDPAELRAVVEGRQEARWELSRGSGAHRDARALIERESMQSERFSLRCEWLSLGRELRAITGKIKSASQRERGMLVAQYASIQSFRRGINRRLAVLGIW